MGSPLVDERRHYSVATVVVATWTGDMDRDRLRQQLDAGADAGDPEAVLDTVDQHMPSAMR